MMVAALLRRSAGIGMEPVVRSIYNRGKPVLTGLQVMEAALLAWRGHPVWLCNRSHSIGKCRAVHATSEGLDFVSPSSLRVMLCIWQSPLPVNSALMAEHWLQTSEGVISNIAAVINTVQNKMSNVCARRGAVLWVASTRIAHTKSLPSRLLSTNVPSATI